MRDEQKIADAFKAIHAQAMIINEVLGRRDDLNQSVPTNWPLNLSADEFAAECAGMSDHYEELAKPLPVGTRVRLIKDVDNYPDVLVEKGIFGTLARIEHDCLWIKLEAHVEGLNDWNNELQIWDWSLDQPDEPDMWSYITAANKTGADPHAICRKWVARLGGGFHPDTRGKDYTPALSTEEIAEYDADMEALFGAASDPYQCAVMAMEDAGHGLK